MFKRILSYIILLSFVPFALALKPEEMGQPWAEIAQLKESRAYDVAIKKLLDHATKSTNTEALPEIYYQIGNIYHEYIHDYNQALEAYQKVVDLSKRAKPTPDLEPYLGLSLMSIADIYRRTGRYNEAIAMYKKVANDYPGTGYVSVAMRDIKGLQEALTSINIQQKVIDNYPNTEFAAEAQFEIAELYMASQGLNNPLRAIQEYKKLIQQYPYSSRAAEAHLKIGNIYRIMLHDPEKAIESYQGLLQGRFASSKVSSEALFRMGRTYYSDLRDYKKALGIFDKLMREYPSYWKFPAAVYWKGMCYEQMLDYENAIETFEIFVQIYPDDDIGLLADIGRLGERNVKDRIIAKIQELKEQSPEILWKQAEQLRSKEQYYESLNIYYNLITNYPDSQHAKKAKIQLELVRKRSEIQINRETARKGGMEAAAAQYRIAEIYEIELYDYPRAIREYDRVIAGYPGTSWTANALYRTGLIYSGMNYSDPRISKKNVKPDYNKAIERFRLLIRQYPNIYKAAEAHYQIGEIYRIHLKDYRQALDAYEKVLSDYPSLSIYYVGEGYTDSIADESLFKIGRIYFENLRDYDVAIKTFIRFLKEYPNSCRKAAAYSFIASIHEKQKSPKAAMDSLEQIIRIIDTSNIQASFFIRDALYADGSSSNNYDEANQQDYVKKEIRRRISRLQGQN